MAGVTRDSSCYISKKGTGCFNERSYQPKGWGEPAFGAQNFIPHGGSYCCFYFYYPFFIFLFFYVFILLPLSITLRIYYLHTYPHSLLFFFLFIPPSLTRTFRTYLSTPYRERSLHWDRSVGVCGWDGVWEDKKVPGHRLSHLFYIRLLRGR